MAHSHGDGGGKAHSAGHSPARALAAALAVILGFAVVEVVAGIVSGSLALLADAAHMSSDALSLGLALFATWLARRPATDERSFGWQRAEILAALANGVALVAISVWILIEAAGRVGDPPEIDAGIVLGVGIAGVLVNVAAAGVLHRSGGESLNVRAALLHVVADLVSSVGVIVAAAVVLATGWSLADPLISAVIGLLVLLSSYRVLRDSLHILLEGTPAGMSGREIAQSLAATPGVVGVHDLHIWTITSGFPALSAHVLVEPRADCHAIRRELELLLRERYELTHTTLQVEHAPGLVSLSR